MKYIEFEFDSEKFWIEIDFEGYALRQVISDANGNAQVSCMEDCLAEEKIELEDIDSIIKDISISDFEDVWRKYTLKYRDEWEESKKQWTIGKLIQGTVMHHYPQGWILKVGSIRAACECECECDLELKVGQVVRGKIRSYDETNMWLELGDMIV